MTLKLKLLSYLANSENICVLAAFHNIQIAGYYTLYSFV